MMKKITVSAGIAVCAVMLSGCASPSQQESDYKKIDLNELKKSTQEKESAEQIPAENAENGPQENTIKRDNMKQYTSVPEMSIDSQKEYTAILHTSSGDIIVSLNAKQTPITVNNFVFLSRDGFYKDVIFHRVIKGFMIQGGDPTGTGSGGPGYSFEDEPVVGEYAKGTLAMANAGPDTNGSQFFIMHADTPLPKNYVIFGKVTSGMEIVDAIANAPVKEGSFGEASTPVNPVVIQDIEIVEE